MAKSVQDTPLMQQHRAIKQKYPDAILLFRVGDFYETFGEDAIRASTVLGITLTKRNNGAASSLELAGFPQHALDTYLHKLVKAGYRVAICDQLEDPKLAKGIVKRGVTEMVTPGLATHDKLLEHTSNNFLAGIQLGENKHGISFLDISTGEFFVAEGDFDYIDKLLQTFQPAEVIFQKGKQALFTERFGKKFYFYCLDAWIFDFRYAEEGLLRHFGTHSLKGFGVEDMQEGIVAAGAILHYLQDTAHPNNHHIASIHRINREEYLWMDQFTIRNLELVSGPTNQAASLLKTVDATVSPMGARMLKRWILMPLVDLTKINERLDLTEQIIANEEWRLTISQFIKSCGDIERLVSKLPSKKLGPREMLQLARGLELVGAIKSQASSIDDPYLIRLVDNLNTCAFIQEKITRQIAEDAPAQTSKGGYIAKGVHQDLDYYRELATGGKNILLEIQQREIINTGISSLKIGFNNVFGYYLEVSNTHKQKVPADWIRKQTLTNGERYITPELKEYEEKIMGAEDKIAQLESMIYDQLLNELQEYILPMQKNAQVLAILDCLCSFAANAIKFNYCKPVLHDDADLQLQAARHPVIEQLLPAGESYVSNDLSLDQDNCQVIILTGPNMSGKSALLRQTAIITLMAHMGSYVPAQKARIPITDKIFTRVGASDNLSGGESTFMVEMNETASIINNISSRSLIILDEIGRGTSTYDGISIACSIAEFLHDAKQRPKTLFATHYHEMNELEKRLPRVKNYHITHKEIDKRIIFLRKLAPGGSTHSFGIHVARMAGMPISLVNRAGQLLAALEKKQISENGLPNHVEAPGMQLTIFDAHTEVFDEIRKMLTEIDINSLTPVEALVVLSEIKKKIN
ncbi:MAG: DNA mismatch repair protein MutS [Chitinophagaceae bacterium]